MSDENAVEPVIPAEPEEPQAPNRFIKYYGIMVRIMVAYWVFRWMQSGSVQQQPHPNSAPSQVTNGNGGNGYSQCVWPLGTKVELFICISDKFMDDEKCELHSQVRHSFTLGQQAWHFSDSIQLENVHYSTEKNQTWFAHIYACRDGSLPSDILAQNAGDHKVMYQRYMLTQFRPYRKPSDKKSLLDSGDDVTETEVSLFEEKELAGKYVPYWYSNITLNVVAEVQQLPVAQLRQVPRILNQFKFIPGSMQTRHYPLIYVDEFWTLKDDVLAHPINETVRSLPLHIEISPYAWWKFQVTQQMEESFSMQVNMMGASNREIDQLKRMFIETNPYLLLLTFCVSLLHSLFDFLAFKNDVQFWQKQKDAEGLSVRSIGLNIILQSIIFLYLFDNETSWMIIVSSGVGVLIEIWKLQKVVKISFTGSRIKFEDRYPKSELGKATDAHDKLAFKYLGIATFPLVIAYSIYSLIYEKHKSWYSWVLGTAVGFVYTFGFIGMTPQLFINYKLKSVAHMPWKTFMYKALNTFIDDLFAFIIKMPTLHRLACFRDDFIFLIYLYQRWIYPVDKSRANEYGQVLAENAVERQVEAEEDKEKTE